MGAETMCQVFTMRLALRLRSSPNRSAFSSLVSVAVRSWPFLAWPLGIVSDDLP